MIAEEEEESKTAPAGRESLPEFGSAYDKARKGLSTSVVAQRDSNPCLSRAALSSA